MPVTFEELEKRYNRKAIALEAAEAERDALKKQVEELEEYQEKLLCENEIHVQCIANIIDTKPGGSIEGQMIAATQMCVRAEQREEELMKKLTALKKDARLLARYATFDYDTDGDIPDYEFANAARRIIEATEVK